MFEEMFSNSIKQLLHTFPLDKTTTTGQPFWSGPKKPPTPIDFDLDHPTHMTFVTAAAIQRAKIYGVEIPEDVDEVYRSFVPGVEVPIFVAKEGEEIPTSEEEAKSQKEKQPTTLMNIDDEVNDIVGSLPDREMLKRQYDTLSPIDFDKDIDEQMIVVMAASNLRATNYKIPEADLHKSRGIAGKIIPAIATTTALVTGLICLELIKVLQDKPLESFRNTFANIGFPTFAAIEPMQAWGTTSTVKGKEWNWSQWDRIEVNNRDITMQGLCDFMKEEYNLEVMMLSQGVSLLLSEFMPKKKRENRLTYPLIQVVEKVAKTTVPPEQKYLIFEAIVSDCDSGDEVEIPYIRLHLR